MNVREVLERQIGRLDARAEVAPGEELPGLTYAMVQCARYLEEKHLQEDEKPMDALAAMRMLVKRAPTVWDVIEDELCPFRFGLPAVNRRLGEHCPAITEECRDCWKEALK